MRRTNLTMGDWKNRVSEVFITAKACRYMNDRIVSLIAERIWPELGRRTKTRATYSSYMKGYVQGLIDFHYDLLWREVEFCYLIDGVLYTTSKSETGKPKLNTLYGTVGPQKYHNAPCGHFWAGTDKPYTLTKPITLD